MEPECSNGNVYLHQRDVSMIIFTTYYFPAVLNVVIIPLLITGDLSYLIMLSKAFEMHQNHTGFKCYITNIPGRW